MYSKKYLPIELVNVRLVSGKFTWCGTCSQNNIRVNSPGEPIDYIYIEYKPVEKCSHYTIRQCPNGTGFDYQHSVQLGQNVLFFPITWDTKITWDIKSFLDNPKKFLEKKKLDRSKPFYLFSHDLKYRSEPINLSYEYYNKGDSTICSICLELIQLEDREILTCGHCFHNDCLMQFLHDKMEICDSCQKDNDTQFNLYEKYGMVVAKSPHYKTKIICPNCRQHVI